LARSLTRYLSLCIDAFDRRDTHKLAFLNEGLALPEIRNACELGFGQGISVNIHSVASNVEWWGTDFNPTQANFAQRLGKASDKIPHLFDDSFAEFCQRTDLPDFDFIAMHGIWTWISDENRDVIVDFLSRKLKVGGVLYISYNTQPGWAANIPLRNLLFEHSQVMGTAGENVQSRVNKAINFTESFISTNPAYTSLNPSVISRFNGIKEQDRNYLAHEFFNKDWQPMLISDMAKWLNSSKLNYATSAHYLDHVDVINLTQEQKQFIDEIHDPIFKATVRDYTINQQFRRDYWVKGGLKISTYERSDLIKKQRLVLVILRQNIVLEVNGFLGAATLSEQVYNPILDVFADFQVKTIEQIETAVRGTSITFQDVWQAIVILVGKGVLAPAQDSVDIAKITPQTEKFNLHVMNLAINSGNMGYLASPVTGGGISVSRFGLLFLLARIQGKNRPNDWANFVLQILVAQNQKLIKEGKTLETLEENLAEILANANTFAVEQLPVLQGLGIV
jgi:SAM-dependent methyltransferase